MSGFDPTRRWLDIALQQERLRRARSTPRAMLKALRDGLRPLTGGERPRCSRSAVSWLHKKGNRRRTELTFSAQTPERLGEHPALPLKNLPELQDGALLTVYVLLVGERVEKFNIGLTGALRDGSSPWFVRVDLDPPLLGVEVDLDGPEGDLFDRLRRRAETDRAGVGLCTHAWPHCHVGRSPAEGRQETRVPVPFMSPPDALAWVLATADPDLEPCGWIDPA